MAASRLYREPSEARLLHGVEPNDREDMQELIDIAGAFFENKVPLLHSISSSMTKKDTPLKRAYRTFFPKVSVYGEGQEREIRTQVAVLPIIDTGDFVAGSFDKLKLPEEYRHRGSQLILSEAGAFIVFPEGDIALQLYPTLAEKVLKLHQTDLITTKDPNFPSETNRQYLFDWNPNGRSIAERGPFYVVEINPEHDHFHTLLKRGAECAAITYKQGPESAEE
jgi:hypothetical protein